MSAKPQDDGVGGGDGEGGGSETGSSPTHTDEEFVLTFEDITVHVPESKGCSPCCSCKDSPIRNYGVEYFGMSVEERAAFYTLDRVSGCVKSGETCLVLGKSGSGKSTLLRALCGRLNETDDLYGTVSLNGIPIGKSNQGWRRMCSYVSADDGTHSPVLTVGETFRFAAQCTSDGHMPNQEIEERVDTMLESLGLSHVKETVVGDENIRGVSGGQKRRVTVGEMLIDPNARIYCLDNITDGLASTDSFSLIEKISAVCRKHRLASIITLLQPSDEIIQLFDNLLVLSSDGQPSYFGPVDRQMLRDVFLGEGADPENDSGSIADLVMNQAMSNDSINSPDSKEDKAANRFLESSLNMELMKELGMLRANAPSIRDRDSALEALLPDNKYSTSRLYQLRIIANRRIKLIMRNSMTYARVVIAIVFGIIVGSLFSALNQDTIGALGRSGYIFLCSFLVLMLSAAVTIPDGFRQRITLFKHRNAEFYSSRAAYAVQVALDLPLSIMEATLIASISYWWVGMTPGADRFFLFLGSLIGLECFGQAFARVLCALSRTQVSANVASSLCILLFATVGGFMPAYGAITWALRWLSWLTPVAYAFEAMMLNQFDGTTFFGLVIVDEDGTSNLGQVDGTNYLNSQSLPRAQWGTNSQIKIFDCLMLFVFSMFLDMIGLYFQERTRQWYFNQIRRPRATVMRSTVKEDSSGIKKSGDVGGDDDAEAQIKNEDSIEPESLAVRNLCYSVNIKPKSKRCWKPRRLTIESVFGPLLTKIAGKSNESKEESEKEKEEEKEKEDDEVTELKLLNEITARFKRGRMTALMGQSGAGKTTLLDVIAGYKTGGNITGDIMIDGRPKVDSTWKAINGYAEQQDILNPYMSVLETIEFTAACRLPSHVDRKVVINNVVQLMGLQGYTNMIVGREKEGEGLPKHARKRLTIANQLVVLPKVLFLDEPTSGLGVNAAAMVMGAVRRSTDALGLITLATIHQPSRKMFESFDDLLLLAKGGKVAYMGELGPNSETLLGHFSSLSGEEPPSSVNPADFVLSILDKGSADDAISAFKQSSLSKEIDSAVDTDVKEAEGQGPSTIAGNPGLTFFTEFGLLFKRQFLVQWRNPSYSFMRMSVSAGATFILGLLFFDIQKNVQGAVFAIAAIFFMTFVLVIPMQAAVIPLIEDRAVLYREAVSGTYSRFTYGLGQLFADIPFHAFNTFIMYAIIYYLVGFRSGAEYVGYFIFMLFLANWCVMSMGQLYALVTPNEETANGLAGLSVILSVCLMGFLITSSAMPDGWLWAYHANLFRYILQGLVTNEVSGQEYNIDVGALIPEIKDTGNSTSGRSRALADVFAPKGKAITFMPGTVPEGDNIPAQAARLMGLALHAGGGENAPESYDDLMGLMECMVQNECLVEPVPTNFIKCNALNAEPSIPPPCVEQFDAVIGYLDEGHLEVAQCFIDAGFDGSLNAPFIGKTAAGLPNSASLDAVASANQRDIAKCLTRKLLPAGDGLGPKAILRGFGDLWNIVMFIRDIIEKGIDIPGDAILFYFGWSEFDVEKFSFSAPWKWHYCVTAVAVFLVAMEAIKLFAVRFIVWTKR